MIVTRSTNTIPVIISGNCEFLCCIFPIKNTIFDEIDYYLWNTSFTCELELCVRIRRTTTILFSPERILEIVCDIAAFAGKSNIAVCILVTVVAHTRGNIND
ncbi:LEAF RUST 10 DISEASE-RESISTANCE LOCUS RECEPTOR-LIKE PROTEIN KINASE 2.4 [Trifolium repens]|nr:LEAF RUST 10 DISEASE-RESISTANCE LOCUS RECEPTOR-LIKE PROTEIN KINASE 2.4 [Trifolium repens]